VIGRWLLGVHLVFQKSASNLRTPTPIFSSPTCWLDSMRGIMLAASVILNPDSDRLDDSGACGVKEARLVLSFAGRPSDLTTVRTKPHCVNKCDPCPTILKPEKPQGCLEVGSALRADLVVSASGRAGSPSPPGRGASVTRPPAQWGLASSRVAMMCLTPFAPPRPYLHPSPEAATCHPKRYHLPILNTPYSILAHSLLHLCTGAPLRFAPLHCLTSPSPPALVSSVCSPCPHVTVPTCPLAASPRSGQPAN